MLSISLDISTRRIVIIGGGQVAARKAAAVLAAGATDVRAVSPVFGTDFPEGIERRIAVYSPAALQGAALVFAATDRADVNDAVVRDARAIGVLVNRADDGDDLGGDFTLPAKVDVGDIRITVSAGSPALSAAVRDRLARHVDPRWAALAAAMKTLRPWVVAQKHLTPVERRTVFRDLAGEEAMGIASGGVDGLRAWIIERHRKLSSLFPR